MGAEGQSLQITISALGRHVTSPHVAQWACTAMVKQLRRTPFNAVGVSNRISEAIKRDLGTILAKSLHHHTQRPKVLEAACRLVVTMSRADVQNQIGNRMLAVAPELAHALMHHPPGSDLQTQGKKALCELQQMGGLPETGELCRGAAQQRQSMGQGHARGVKMPEEMMGAKTMVRMAR